MKRLLCEHGFDETIAEVEEIVPVGSIDPENIHLSSVYVDRIVKVEDTTKKIEFRTVTTRG